MDLQCNVASVAGVFGIIWVHPPVGRSNETVILDCSLRVQASAIGALRLRISRMSDPAPPRGQPAAGNSDLSDTYSVQITEIVVRNQLTINV